MTDEPKNCAMKKLKPTIEISCWHCKRYDAELCRCRKRKREITWEDAHNGYCFDWASKKRSVSSALCDFAKNALQGTIEENGGFHRVKGGGL